MNELQEYINYRIRTLRKAKKDLIEKKCNGWKELLWETNSRLSELESIAINFRFYEKEVLENGK